MIDEKTRVDNQESEILQMSTRIRGNLYDAAERLAEDPEADVGSIINTIAGQNASLRTMVLQKRALLRNCCDQFDRRDRDALA